MYLLQNKLTFANNYLSLYKIINLSVFISKVLTLKMKILYAFYNKILKSYKSQISLLHFHSIIKVKKKIGEQKSLFK